MVSREEECVQKEWVFRDLPNTMVLTTQDIISGHSPILLVYHDADDGMWQFHAGEEVNIDLATLVSLREIVEMDYTVSLVADLPLGWIAWRDSKDTHWSKNEN
jgi:hypothetical protein